MILIKLPGLLLFLGMLTACTEPLYTNLDNAQLIEMMEKGVPLYDVRRADEWKHTGVIEGSKLLTIIGEGARLNPNFMTKFTRSVDKNSPVILICRTGSRTRKLAEHLTEQLGYTQVYHLRNGIMSWIREGRGVQQVRF